MNRVNPYPLEMPGIVQAPTWAAGASDQQTLIDIEPREDFLPWDVSVEALEGRVALTASYGATARRVLTELTTPFSCALPGWVTVTAVPVGAGPTAALVSVTYATNQGGFMRSGILTGPVAIPPGAYRYHAVSASTVDQDGFAVAVAAGAVLDITDPSVLTAGDGWAEFAV